MLPLATKVRYGGKAAKKGTPLKRGLMKIHRQGSIEFQTPKQHEQQWRDIRSGVKLRNIVQSMRVNEVQQMTKGQTDQRCIIQRHLGHKDLMPGSSQWSILTRQKDECWICARYVMTVFIWTPRIGNFAGEKDPNVLNHYKTQVKMM